jgi:hypothetical protein
MNDRMVRGSVPMGVLSYLERRDGKAMSSVSPELRDGYRSMSRGAWYPLAKTVDLYRAVSLLHEDPNARYDELVKCGKFLAHDATNTFLRLLIRFLTPAVFARKFPEFWKKDHTFGSVESDTTKFEEKTIILNLTGVDGYEFIGPVCLGWIHAAFEAIGKKGVTVAETAHPPTQSNADSYRFVLKWQH